MASQNQNFIYCIFNGQREFINWKFAIIFKLLAFDVVKIIL